MSTLMDQLLADQFRLRAAMEQRNGGRTVDTHTAFMDPTEPSHLPHMDNRPNDAHLVSLEGCACEDTTQNDMPPGPRDSAAFWSVVCASCFGLAAVVAWAVVAFFGRAAA